MVSILLQAEGQEMSGLMNIVFIVAIFVIFYFFMIRPQKQQQKELEKMRENLKKGDHIVTIGGIHGKVAEVKEDGIIVEISDSVKVKFDKSAIATIAKQ